MMANKNQILVFKNSSHTFAISISLALHILLGVGIFYFSKLQDLNFQKSSPLVLEFSPPPTMKLSPAISLAQKAHPQGGVKSTPNNTSTKGRMQSTAKALNPIQQGIPIESGDLFLADKFLPDKSWKKSKLLEQAMTIGRGDAQIENWGNAKTEVLGRMNSMGLNEVLETQSFYQEIWNRIESKLTFPPDMVNARLAGLIYVEAQINHKGQLTGNTIRVRGTDAVLQSLALATTITALNDPLPKNLWLKEDTIPVGFYFDFRYTLDPTGELEGLQGQTKNLLHFFRYGHATPALTKLASRLPIFPAPGMVFINFVRIYEIIHDWDKPSEEELRNIRLDNLKKKFQETIDSSSMKSS